MGERNSLATTPEEERAIASLRRLAKRWPKSLWLFAASGTLCVMQTDEDGRRVHKEGPGGGVDPAHLLSTVSIPCDGGDW